MAEQQHQFQAEVSRVLNIVINSLYSNKEIFLRELISNASDACDKLRYLTLTQPKLVDVGDLKIEITTHKKNRSVTVADNGIGMNCDELMENLGTIARSGTSEFLDSLTGDQQKDATLIGQFGVGFYSCFSVAKKVEVVSRKAGDDQAWHWESEGDGNFTIGETEREQPGTSVTVYLAKGESEFLEEARIRHIVHTYSDHISIPIVIHTKEGENQINTASALWARSKSEVTEEQYTEFYHHVGHVFDQPWLTMHNRAEGKIEYTNLLFVPSSRPFDLMDPDRKHRIKLYVKRVFITDDCEDLLPGYLRFVRGIVDSEDLPLNVSREMLQRNAVVNRIRTALVRRVFGELKKKAEKESDEYAMFWDNFGAVLKEGLYEDQPNHEKLFELVRFYSTCGDGLVSLTEYVNQMKDGQEEIYYITGEDRNALRKSPQLEGFTSRGLEVLLLSDPIDDFWLPMVGSFQEKPFKSITASDVDIGKFKAKKTDKEDTKPKEKADETELAKLILAFKEALGDGVKDVRSSERLTDSPVCLVADAGDPDLNFTRMMKRQGHMQMPESPRILEINPSHTLIKRMSEFVDDATKQADLKEFAWLLFDQARIVEGEQLVDLAAFSQRFNSMMVRGLN